MGYARRTYNDAPAVPAKPSEVGGWGPEKTIAPGGCKTDDFKYHPAWIGKSMRMAALHNHTIGWTGQALPAIFTYIPVLFILFGQGGFGIYFNFWSLGLPLLSFQKNWQCLIYTMTMHTDKRPEGKSVSRVPGN